MFMLDNWYYFMEDGELYRFALDWDEEPLNPREDNDGNLGHMYCECRNYDLGDNTDYDDLDGLKRAMINAAGITEEKIVKYFKAGKVPGVELMIDDLIEELSLDDIINLSGGEIVALRLYLYDHSGISMSCDSFIGKVPYAEWDSGCVGLIWSTVSEAKQKTGFKCNNAEWQEVLAELLKMEVIDYNQYLEGDCYYFTEEKFDYDSEEWNETDSYGGIYPIEPWDCESILTNIYGTDFLFYETEEKAEEAYTTKKTKEAA